VPIGNDREREQRGGPSIDEKRGGTKEKGRSGEGYLGRGIPEKSSLRWG